MDLKMTEVLRKAQIVSILEYMCQSLELTPTQQESAQSRYEAVGHWLGASGAVPLDSVAIYPQGSVALGTTVRPIGRDEYDVDLICFFPGLGVGLAPATLKSLIGRRLRENGQYRGILEERPRCWRINYANEFHLDITPSIKNPACLLGGELVPDGELMMWKATNPKGHRSWFEERARLTPRIRLTKAALAEGFRASLEPFPAPIGFKGILRRTVQLQKRHRDLHFQKLDASLRPISIIITTLAASSYAYCVSAFEYDDELDLVRDVIRHMLDFIEERSPRGGRKQWFIPNETTLGENFAEKWNTDPSRAKAFFEWHAKATADLDKTIDLAGLDRITKHLSESFGEAPISKAMRAMTEKVSSARSNGHLAVAPGLGLTVGAGIDTKVRRNTFFGAE